MDSLSEIVVSFDQLKDGVTVLVYKNVDGLFERIVGNCESSKRAIKEIQTRDTADGILDWAVFHVGFVDWNDNTGRLYLYVSADEPMNNIYGYAYVKHYMFPSTYYYNSFFSEYLYGYTNQTRVLCEDVDTGNTSHVIVGFRGVYMYTVAGDRADFTDGAQLVPRDVS